MTQEQMFAEYEKVKGMLPDTSLVFRFIVKMNGLLFYSEDVAESKLTEQLDFFDRMPPLLEIKGMEYAADYGWDYEWRTPGEY